MKVVSVILLLFFAHASCQRESRSYKILGNVEDPQNEIAHSIAAIARAHTPYNLKVIPGISSLANLDSLEKGNAHFGIVDNFSRLSDDVQAVLPLYPQVLHILHKKDIHPQTLPELFSSGKIYAGVEGSVTRRFIMLLMHDFGIDAAEVEFVDVFDLFKANVIFAFTDLLGQDELRDLTDFTFYSLDDVAELGKGSLAEGICARYPQFDPYIIPRSLYGSFTATPVLTVKVDALLVCRADLEPAVVYTVLEALRENAKDLKDINPLLHSISFNINEDQLNFALHKGTRDYVDRDEPSFLEKYAEIFSVIICNPPTVFVTLASSIYTISKWQKARKKNKIDVYYQKLLNIRGQIDVARSAEQLQ